MTTGMMGLGEEWERRLEADALIAAIKNRKIGPAQRRQKTINDLLFSSLRAAAAKGGENADTDD